MEDTPKGPGVGYPAGLTSEPVEALRKRQLTARPQAGNRRVGRKRAAVEHGIGKTKTWRIAAEKWRNPHRTHRRVMKNTAGLHNRTFG